MSRARVYGEDLTYAEEHRNALPALYGRIGHRLDLADRDWTEFCHHCKEPIAIYEQVMDRGQDLADKATRVTGLLARRASLPAFLMAWRTQRPQQVQTEIDALNRRLRELEAAYPIVEFKFREIWPCSTRTITAMAPAQWWEWLLILHRNHHATCVAAQRTEIPVDGRALLAAVQQHPANAGRLLPP